MSEILKQEEIDTLLKELQNEPNLQPKRLGEPFICIHCNEKVYIEVESKCKSIKLNKRKRSCAHFLKRL